VHPGEMTIELDMAGPAGTIDGGPKSLLGLAEYDGPVLIAWDSVRTGPVKRRDNVVYHEFAHKLDFADGLVDGTPVLHTRDGMAHWVDVCTREFEALREHGDELLDDYAATNVAEFFAVVTEVFFELPDEFESRKPELYGVLRDFYRQDPAARVRARPLR
jgi:Mlc titration factor MtfA (ptsG expression regulator)